jgi:hypothetical protein
LDQRADHGASGVLVVEIVEVENRGECATGGDFEYRAAGGVVAVPAGPAKDCRPVEVSVGALYQRVDISAVCVPSKLCSVVSVPPGVILKTVP